MDHASETLALASLQGISEPVPFSEAINYMASKVPLTSKEYYALDDELRFRAFTVSRLTQVDTIEKVRRHLVKSVADGRTLSEFQTQEGIDEALQVAGFMDKDPWYWETVYRTNIQTAYNTGRLMQYEKNPPLFLEFIGIEDGRQTTICWSRRKTILPYGDAWWNSNYPPLHFKCRSTVRAIYKEEADIRGLTAGKVPEGIADPGKGFGKNPVKSKLYYELTPAMKERAIKYGIDTEFLTAAVDANLADYARTLINDGLKASRILFENIADSGLRQLAEEAMNPEIPIRTEALQVVDKYKDQVKVAIGNHDCFIPGRGIIFLEKRTLRENLRFVTFRHEFGHALDHQVNNVVAGSAGEEFLGIIKGVNSSLAGKAADPTMRKNVIEFINKYYDDPSVSDLFCSITGRTDSALYGKYVHPARYYKNFKWRSVECFANLFDLYCMNDERWKFLEKTIPALTAGFEKVLKGL